MVFTLDRFQEYSVTIYTYHCFRSAVAPRFRFRFVVISTSDNYVILNSAM